MKIGGKEVSGPSEEVLVLPRIDGDIVLKARAVLDMDEFNNMCPMPKAPGMLTKDGFSPNTNAPAYKQQVADHANKRFAFIVLKSLEPSEIEWDTVDADKPSTWTNWEKDLAAAGFNGVEVQRITVLVMQANSLDEGKLKAARDSFLLGQALQQAAHSGQDIEPESTQSGQPASDSE